MTVCPHCSSPLKIAIYPGKKKATNKRGLFQLATSLLAKKQPDKPFVRLTSIVDKQMYIDELLMTDNEFKRMAYAISRNDWLFSVPALERWGEFTSYRAKEIAGHLSDMNLRFVDDQNRSTLLPHVMAHLRNAL